MPHLLERLILGVRYYDFVTFRVRRSRGEMYIGHGVCESVSVCVSVCLFLAEFQRYCMDPDVTWGWGNGSGDL